jgi:hypothetical protein
MGGPRGGHAGRAALVSEEAAKSRKSPGVRYLCIEWESLMTP